MESTIGNIWVQQKSGLLGWIVSHFTGSDWVHVGVDLGDGNIAHVDVYGRHFTKYRKWKGKTVILAPVESLTEEQQVRLRVYALSDTVLGYDFFHAIISLFWKNKNDEKSPGKFYHCSEFVSAIYRKIGIDLFPGLSDDAVQPQDFMISTKLTVIG